MTVNTEAWITAIQHVDVEPLTAADKSLPTPRVVVIASNLGDTYVEWHCTWEDRGVERHLTGASVVIMPKGEAVISLDVTLDADEVPDAVKREVEIFF